MINVFFAFVLFTSKHITYSEARDKYISFKLEAYLHEKRKAKEKRQRKEGKKEEREEGRKEGRKEKKQGREIHLNIAKELTNFSIVCF